MIYIDENIFGFDLEAALGKISAQRREQALKFRHELGRRQCVLAYLLLKQGLKEEFELTENPLFEYGEHGKPAIVGHPEIHFNMSHCREAVACAVSTRPIGVDVESLREYKEGLVRYTMNDEEAREIGSADDPTRAFIRFWTMKEATMKLIGTGISNDMKTVIDTTKYKYTTVNRQRYIYTVCE